MNRVFTVVIPTLNRADVLRYAIATCVAQNDSNFRILISDNGSSDATRATVQAFSDSRIRYINPGRTLGMPEHWEFALEHVEPGFVCVVGDDDGLLPDAVARARQILQQLRVDALAWRKAEYHWPDHIVPSYRNWLQIPMIDRTEIYKSQSILRDVLAYTRTYTDLPCIYNSFVATHILDAVRSQCDDRLFPCITPDMYSGFAVACAVDEYAFSLKPLSINAASRHSNGTLASIRGVEDGEARQHFTLTAERIHPKLVRCSSVPVLIADAALVAQSYWASKKRWPQLDWGAMLELAARYSERQPKEVMAETIAALDEIARRNGVIDVWAEIRRTIVHIGLPQLQPPGWDPAGTHLAIDGGQLGLRNVLDAAVLVDSVLCTDLQSTRGNQKLRRRALLCAERADFPVTKEVWAEFLVRQFLARPKQPGIFARSFRKLRRGVRELLSRSSLRPKA